MKFLAAVLVWLGMAVLIGWAMLQAVHGSPWPLLLSLLAFIVAMLRIGCTSH